MDSRRRLALALIGLAPLVMEQAAKAQPAACFDPNTLPLSQKSRRRSLKYVEPSPDPARQCGGCSFYKASDVRCGTCTMLTGGPVSANGLCNFFAAKTGQ